MLRWMGKRRLGSLTGDGEHLAKGPWEVAALLAVDVVQIVHGLVQSVRPQGGVCATRLPNSKRSHSNVHEA